MANWLSAIMDPLKAAGDTAKGLVEIRDTVKFGDAIIKLHAQIMSAYEGAAVAQARQTEMAEEIGQFKNRVAELETWEAQKKRYQLTDFGGGTFAYALKEGMDDGEPLHRICPKCYEDSHRSILQFQHQSIHQQDKYECPACKKEFMFGVRRSFEGGVVKSDFNPFG